MSFIEAIYIADNNEKLIFEYLIKLNSLSFRSLISNVNVRAAADLPIVELNDFLVFYYSFNKLTFFILTKNDKATNPLLPFLFINKLIDVMENYFSNPLTASKIEGNYDTLVLLINEMVEDGIPYITDVNRLRDLIPFKSFLSKIMSTNLNLNGNKSSTSLSSMNITSTTPITPIPWRRSNVKYTNNELFVDLIETIDVILTPSHAKSFKNGTFDSAFYSSHNSSSNLMPKLVRIDGKIEFTSHLSGIPDLQLILNPNGLDLGVPAFHECVRLDKWLASPGYLSFIPPDGKFRLCNYTLDFDSTNPKHLKNYLGLMDIDVSTGLGVYKNEFEIKLITKFGKSVKFENVKVDINCKEQETLKSNRITHGDFNYKGNGSAEWNLRTLQSGITAIFRGNITNPKLEVILKQDPNEINSNDLLPIEPSLIKLNYTSKGNLPSGMKVDSLKILSAKGMGDSVKPYKGVKYLTRTGEFIIR